MSRRPKAPHGCFWNGNVLWGRAQVRGRDHKWSLFTDDTKVARQRRKEGKDRLVAALRFGEVRLSFDHALEGWEKWIEKQAGVSANTIVRYACSLGQLEPFLNGKLLDEVNGKLVAEIVDKRTAAGATVATVRRDLVALSSVMNCAIDRGWLEANPVLPRIRRLKERRDPIVLPEHAHIDLVAQRAPGALAALVRAALATGARQDELVQAERSRLDSGRKQLTVVGKGNKLRVIDLEPFGGLAIFRALPASFGCRWLFWHGTGKQYRNASSRFAAIVKWTATWAEKERGRLPPLHLPPPPAQTRRRLAEVRPLNL